MKSHTTPKYYVAHNPKNYDVLIRTAAKSRIQCVEKLKFEHPDLLNAFLDGDLVIDLVTLSLPDRLYIFLRNIRGFKHSWF